MALAFAITGCTKKYKITFEGGEDLLESCPKKAAPGETVTVKTMSVTDADLYVRVNGDKEFGHFVRDCEYEFIMPEGDVVIKIWIITNGGA